MDLEEDTYTSIFTALKHPVRRRVLRMLGEGPVTYTEILNGLGVETSFLNYHLESLQGLITKDAGNRYCLSEFGEVSLNLIERVEAPVRRRKGWVSILGFRLSRAYIFLSVIAILMVSNAYLVYGYRGISRDRDNALGEALIQARGYLGESIYILDHALDEGGIELELIEVLQDDLIQLSRYYRLVMSLDTHHWKQWGEIQAATDGLLDFVEDLDNYITVTGELESRAYMTIQGGQSSALAKIRDDLAEIGWKAFPEKITMGSNPKVEISDSEITEAMEAAVQLDNDVVSARNAFNLKARVS